MADDLYERDFYLWTQAQAEALRTHGVSNRIDWDVIAEEVEDMDKRELRAAESLVVRIIEHLHKLRATQVDEPAHIGARKSWPFVIKSRAVLRHRYARISRLTWNVCTTAA